MAESAKRDDETHIIAILNVPNKNSLRVGWRFWLVSWLFRLPRIQRIPHRPVHAIHHTWNSYTIPAYTIYILHTYIWLIESEVENERIQSILHDWTLGFWLVANAQRLFFVFYAVSLPFPSPLCCFPKCFLLSTGQTLSFLFCFGLHSSLSSHELCYWQTVLMS